jgi:hypothetical protein
VNLALVFVAAALAQEEPTEATPPASSPPEPAAEQRGEPPPVAQEPPPPIAEEPKAPPPPPPTETFRSEGMRLALDLGFWRSSGTDPGRTNAGSPSLIPIGAAVSWHTSRRVLLGVHGHAGLASRDDCLGDTSCTGRGYGLGAHIEAAFGSSPTFIPYFRYSLGWEMVHHLGAFKNGDAYRYRHAFDILDVRFGGDFVVARGSAGRTTRIGPFVGMIVGVGIDEVPESARRGVGPEGHVWFNIGARGTTDW